MQDVARGLETVTNLATKRIKNLLVMIEIDRTQNVLSDACLECEESPQMKKKDGQVILNITSWQAVRVFVENLPLLGKGLLLT